MLEYKNFLLDLKGIKVVKITTQFSGGLDEISIYGQEMHACVHEPEELKKLIQKHLTSYNQLRKSIKQMILDFNTCSVDSPKVYEAVLKAKPKTEEEALDIAQKTLTKIREERNV